MEKLDELGITLTEEEPRPRCGYGKCQCEATHVASFRIMWGCTHTQIFYCLAHKDVLLALCEVKNGFFHHQGCPGSVTRFARIDPVTGK
jgi:hypothetical protein